jgi:hypothetical protein
VVVKYWGAPGKTQGLTTYQSVQVGLRTADGYVNATAMAAAHRERTGQQKKVSHWLENKRTQETLRHLSSVTGIPVTELYQVLQGVHHEQQGTWIHPKLAVRFGMWLSDEFGLAVESWVDEWRSQPTQPAIPQSFAEALMLAAKQQEAIELQQAQIALLEEATKRQAEVIDELFDYSSIIRIAKYNGCKEDEFKWHTLKAASKALKLEIKKAPCSRYGEKNLYSHDAWRLAYPGYRLPETTTLVINSQALEG